MRVRFDRNWLYVKCGIRDPPFPSRNAHLAQRAEGGSFPRGEVRGIIIMEKKTKEQLRQEYVKARKAREALVKARDKAWEARDKAWEAWEAWEEALVKARDKAE